MKKNRLNKLMKRIISSSHHGSVPHVVMVVFVKMGESMTMSWMSVSVERVTMTASSFLVE